MKTAVVLIVAFWFAMIFWPTTHYIAQSDAQACVDEAQYQAIDPDAPAPTCARIGIKLHVVWTK